MSDNNQKFTPKEQEAIASFEEVITNRGASIMDKQIAEARLYDLKKSKEPEPHKHKQRIQGEREDQGGSDHNMFHNDEAFERYEMGGHQRHEPGNKGDDVAAKNYQSVRMNHKARGTSKQKAEETAAGDLHFE
ncbi:hypothetical protein NLJ89_g10789 [Agrocybe chaxingu]|uniref:Uncharacterized protein n=1 Tax=Agrocybe chaxingu TaxID=84603 RepID=A0A9W8JTL8_9AGAR|nr:hypothetical protein NLJ89_g10789 [Agrocybe chaxingu]